jgi:DNA-binding Lrp family transcriptional regulator
VSTKAYVLLNVKSGASKKVVKALSEIRGVKAAHACWGRPDIFAYVEVKDERALGSLVLSRIQTIAGVQETDTHIVIQE